MSEIEVLIKAYERFVRLPWEHNLPGPRRVWFVQYDPAQERRLRPRIGEFQTATLAAGHAWVHVDLTDAFPEWMASHDYREAYFEQPEDMGMALEDFAEAVTKHVEGALTSPEADENAVVAMVGLASLFGFTRASALIARVAPLIRGRLLGFFPGSHEGSNWRLLDARDGWDYHAVAITAASRWS